MRVHPALVRQVRWRRAGSPVFMWAALVGGSWWVLRLNDFPEHPLYSFFTVGQLAGDIDDLPPAWLTTTSGTAPLTAGERRLAGGSGQLRGTSELTGTWARNLRVRAWT